VNKSFANTYWNRDLYCQVYSSALAYVGWQEGTEYHLEHVIDIETDPCWNRLIYSDQQDGQASRMRAHGSFGKGTDSLYEPMAVKVVSLTSDTNWYLPYYDIFVADRGNHRVQQLRYRWTTPDSGLIHARYLTTDLWRPTDLDYSVGPTFDGPYDDLVWVACKSDKIVAFWAWSGQELLTYGSTGSGSGQFDDIRAVVCGKTRFNQSTGVWFANNDYVYVLDAGNNRIVRLSRPTYNTIQWDKTFDCPSCYPFTDLEVDVCGHIWATAENGTITKFTPDLSVLGTFGSAGTGENQFDNPVSIANTGGHLGGGDMMICENWTEQSGLQHYAIGVDVSDLFVNTRNVAGTCYSDVCFLLVDYASVTINIKDSAGTTVIKNLKSNWAYGSGTQLVTWNGRNKSNTLVPWGTYRAEVTASSMYKNSSGQPVNTVTESVLFTMCGGACQWLVGDADGSGSINISDAVYLIAYIFAQGDPPTPHPVGSGDADCSHSVNISDAVYLIAYIFSHGPAPGQTCDCTSYSK